MGDKEELGFRSRRRKEIEGVKSLGGGEFFEAAGFVEAV